MQKLVRSPLGVPFITTIVIALLVATLFVGQTVHRSLVIGDGVLAAAATGPVNVEVHLGFGPEKFNLAFLQKYANAVSIQGESAMLFGATTAGIEAIAAQFWVRSITIVR